MTTMLRIGDRPEKQNVRRLDVFTLICEVQRLDLQAALLEKELRRRGAKPEDWRSRTAEIIRAS